MMIIWNSTKLSGLWGNYMSNNLVIRPEALGDAISEQLELYQKSVETKIDKCAAKATNELVRITKDTAPFNAKHHGRHFVNCIASKKEKGRIGVATYTWHVKAPCHRLTHLLVNGHPMPNGEHYDGDPFLKNACDKVLPEFEENVKKAVKDGN